MIRNMSPNSISICIPTYNRFDTLRRTLEEITNQENFNDIEIVISDNNSSDGTSEIKDLFPIPNLKYYSNEKNLGANYNIVKVISLAINEFVLLVSDEDSVNIKKLVDAVELMRRSNAGVLLSELRHLNKKYYGFSDSIFTPGVDSLRENGFKTSYISGLVMKKSDIDFGFLFSELNKENNGVLNTFPHNVIVNQLLLTKISMTSSIEIVTTRENAEMDIESIDFIENWQTPYSRVGQFISDLEFFRQYVPYDNEIDSIRSLALWRYRVYLGTVFLFYFDSKDYDSYYSLNIKKYKSEKSYRYYKKLLRTNIKKFLTNQYSYDKYSLFIQFTLIDLYILLRFVFKKLSLGKFVNESRVKLILRYLGWK